MKDIGRLKREIESRRRYWRQIANLVVSSQFIGVLGSMPLYVAMRWWGVDADPRNAITAIMFICVSLFFSGGAIVMNHLEADAMQEKLWDAEDSILQEDA